MSIISNRPKRRHQTLDSKWIGGNAIISLQSIRKSIDYNLKLGNTKAVERGLKLLDEQIKQRQKATQAYLIEKQKQLHRLKSV